MTVTAPTRTSQASRLARPRRVIIATGKTTVAASSLTEIAAVSAAPANTAASDAAAPLCRLAKIGQRDRNQAQGHEWKIRLNPGCSAIDLDWCHDKHHGHEACIRPCRRPPDVVRREATNEAEQKHRDSYVYERAAEDRPLHLEQRVKAWRLGRKDLAAQPLTVFEGVEAGHVDAFVEHGACVEAASENE